MGKKSTYTAKQESIRLLGNYKSEHVQGHITIYIEITQLSICYVHHIFP